MQSDDIRAAPQREYDGRVIWRGTIVDPRNGSAYHAQMIIGADHQLKLRGYVALPIFGLTQTLGILYRTWRRGGLPAEPDATGLA